jgi:NAD(P)H-hydrate epimerase
MSQRRALDVQGQGSAGVLLPARDPAGHKGTFGTVAVVGGHASAGRMMIGAPALAATAALRAGCGLARLVMPAPVLAQGLVMCPSATGTPIAGDAETGLSSHASEVVGALGDADVVVLGPGLGMGSAERKLVLALLRGLAVPIVLDADGINNLPANMAGQRLAGTGAPVVLTPHPGEYRRLAATFDEAGTGASDLSGHDPVDDLRRPAAAKALALMTDAIVVLKGHRTVVTDGHEVVINQSGNDALATGGTGDVLSGLIAGLLAQYPGPPHGPGGDKVKARRHALNLVVIAVRVHGLAGDLWRQRTRTSAGLLARELCDLLPAALEGVRGRGV